MAINKELVQSYTVNLDKDAMLVDSYKKCKANELCNKALGTPEEVIEMITQSMIIGAKNNYTSATW